MKLWELFDEKYIKREVEWIEGDNEKHSGHVGKSISGAIIIVEDGTNVAKSFSQSEMQTLDFEVLPKCLSFTELENECLYGIAVKFVYNEIVIVGVFTTIIELLISALASDELIKALLNGKWYILANE